MGKRRRGESFGSGCVTKTDPMKRLFYLCLLFFPLTAPAVWGQEQKVAFGFAMMRIDSTYDVVPPVKVSRLMDFYRPEMERRMMEVVGYAPDEMRSFRPESPLSNFAADALLTVAQQYTQSPVDFSLTNFGGLRASFPKGEVRLYDVYAVFPFENTLVILDLEGKDVQELFDNFARRNRMEAVGNVEVEIENGKVRQLWIAGVPFDPDRRYRVATIDFLLDGGDGVAALKKAVGVEETGVMIRDVVAQYISMLQREGKEVAASVDGRVKMIGYE